MERTIYRVMRDEETIASLAIETEISPTFLAEFDAYSRIIGHVITSLFSANPPVNQANPPGNQANPPGDPFRGKGHGLDKPRNESQIERMERIGAEFERQRGYNAGLRGNPAESEGEIYTAAYAKGCVERPFYVDGWNDGVAGMPKTQIDHYPYVVGYEEGSKSVKA